MYRCRRSSSFKSGSAVVGKEGEEALGKIAQVLNNDPKIKIVVEGAHGQYSYQENF